MPEMENLQLFDDQAIRTAWNKEEEEWYFSVVDVVGVLTDQPDVRRAAKYWSVLKTRIKKENGQLTTICSQLKLKAKEMGNDITRMLPTQSSCCASFSRSLQKRRSRLSCGWRR